MPCDLEEEGDTPETGRSRVFNTRGLKQQPDQWMCSALWELRTESELKPLTLGWGTAAIFTPPLKTSLNPSSPKSPRCLERSTAVVQTVKQLHREVQVSGGWNVDMITTLRQTNQTSGFSSSHLIWWRVKAQHTTAAAAETQVAPTCEIQWSGREQHSTFPQETPRAPKTSSPSFESVFFFFLFCVFFFLKS